LIARAVGPPVDEKLDEKLDEEANEAAVDIDGALKSNNEIV